MASVPNAATIAVAVHKIQHALLDAPTNGALSDQHLLAAASLISSSDYEDVVVERSIADLCGYPLCPNPLPSLRSRRRGRYRISLRDHKVFDLQETYKYCSEPCLISSRAYAASLAPERTADIRASKIDAILALFRLGGRTGIEDLLSNLKIQEKNGGPEVSSDQWVGPSNAIDGYVPQFDVKQMAEQRFQKSKDKNKVERNINDFATEGDGSEAMEILEEITKKLEERVHLGDKDSETTRSKGNNHMDFTSSIIFNDKQLDISNNRIDHKIEPRLKSSLKKSGEKNINRSVKWADGGEHAMDEEDEHVGKSIEQHTFSPAEVIDDNLRLASAEACASALAQASGAVEAGITEVESAVSEAGIIILPQPQSNGAHDTEENHEENAGDEIFEFDRGYVKWPKKTVLLDTEMFEVEDSWHDTPPEGFNLNLSSFATMWMSLFEWITCSSLAYIYGHDEGSEEEFMVVSGREYCRKIVMEDGKSYEIKRTIEGCICRALPGLVVDLKLPIPVSTLEKNLGCLLDTMTFVAAVPSFKLKQWQVILLLFLEALSVNRLPSLTVHLTNRDMLSHKVLKTADITSEEYETMRDLIMPLGRFPDLCMQRGG